MIFSVTPNPAIDRTLIIPRFSAGGVFRAVQEVVTVGGKGMNVSRVIRFLGGTVTCLGFVGGYTGRYFAALAEAEGFAAHWTWVSGEGLEKAALACETRTCTIVLDGQGSEPSVLNTNGPTVTARDWEHLAEDLLGLAQVGDTVGFSGSLPPGSPLAAYAGLISRLGQAGSQVWVDSSHQPLRAALEAAPFGVKVNGEEIGEILNRDVGSPTEAIQAARAVRERGITMVAVTLGKVGAVLSTPGGDWHASIPEIQAVSNVGSGDAFLGGLMHALQKGRPVEEALRRATAAGAANALSSVPGTLQDEDYAKCLESTRITTLS